MGLKDKIKGLYERRKASGGDVDDQKMKEALERAEGQVKRYENLVTDLARQRQSGRTLDAQLISPKRMVHQYRHGDLVRRANFLKGLDRDVLINRLISQFWQDQSYRFKDWKDADKDLGSMICHRENGREGFNPALEKDKTFQIEKRWMESLLSNPTGDERTGSSYADLLHYFQDDYRKFDNVAITFAFKGRNIHEARRKKRITDIIVLDGGTVFPVIHSIADYNRKKGVEDRRLYEKKIIEDGIRYFARQFGVKPEEISKAGYVQMDDAGFIAYYNPGEIIVKQRHKTTDSYNRGMGFSPLEQSIEAIEAWMESLENDIEASHPGANLLKQVLAWTTNSSDVSSMDFRQATAMKDFILELIQDSSNPLPIVPLGPNEDLKSVEFDPQGKHSERGKETMVLLSSIVFSIHGVDPRDVNFASSGRIEESGQLSSSSVAYEQSLTRNERVSARLMYISEISNAIVQWLGGHNYRLQLTGMSHTLSLEERVKIRSDMSCSTIQEDREELGNGEIDEENNTFKINKRVVKPYLWPKHLKETNIELLRMEKEEAAEEEQGADEMGEATMEAAMQ